MKIKAYSLPTQTGSNIREGIYCFCWCIIHKHVKKKVSENAPAACMQV